jgi:hypothetical protein
MPMTTDPQPIMKANNSGSAKTHGDKVREQYDTENLRAIMSRFLDAVSWRDN